MSHSVIVTVSLEEQDKEILLNLCSELCNKLKTESEKVNYEPLNKIVDEKIKEITLQTQEKLAGNISFSGSASGANLQMQLFKDKIIKEVSNYLNSINYLKELSKLETKTKVDHIKWINKYGTTAYFAIQNLVDRREMLTDESIGNEIDRILTLESSEKQKEEFITTVKTWLATEFKKFPDLQSQFFQLAKRIDSLQEMNDFLVYLTSKKNALNEIGLVMKPIINEVKIQNNYMVKECKLKLDTEHNLKVHYYFLNQLNESFELIISDDLKIQYKIGDYKSHCCEQTSQRIFEALKKNRIVIKDYKINRNFNNEKPLYKAITKVKKG